MAWWNKAVTKTLIFGATAGILSLGSVGILATPLAILLDETVVEKITGTVEGIGGELFGGLSEQGLSYFCDHFAKDGEINHDIEKSLRAALVKALKQLKGEWNTAHPDDKRAKSFMKQLVKEAPRLFDHPSFKSLLKHEQFTFQATRKDKGLDKPLQESNWLWDSVSLHHWELYKFLEKELPNAWVIQFREQLKDPNNETGTKAWRAYLRLYQEALLHEMNEMKQSIGKLQTDSVAGFQETQKMVQSLTTRFDLVLDGARQSNLGQERLRDIRVGFEPASLNIRRVANELQTASNAIHESVPQIETATKALANAAAATDVVVSRLQASNDRLEALINKLSIQVDRLERIADELATLTDNIPVFAMSVLYGGFTWWLLWQKIATGNYYGSTVTWTWVSILFFLLLLGGLVWALYPGREQARYLSPVKFVARFLWWVGLYGILAATLIGVGGYLIPATYNERTPMDKEVNILIANFIGDENQLIGQLVSEGMQDRLFKFSGGSETLSPDKIAIRRFRLIGSDEEANAIAQRLNANLVIWGGQAGNDFSVRFVIHDPVEGGMDIAMRMNIPPYERGGTFDRMVSERAEIITTFVRGLYYLFLEQPEATKATAQFDRSLDIYRKIISNTNKQQTIYLFNIPIGKITEQVPLSERENIEYVLLFFKGRSLTEEYEILYQANNKTPTAETQQKLEQSMQAYSETIALNEQYTWAYIGRGNIYYSQALEENPSNVLLMEQAIAEYKRAIDSYKQPLTNAPAPIAYVIAKAYVNIGNVDNVLAREHLEGSVPTDYKSYLLKSTKAYTQALEAYERAAKVNQHPVEGRYLGVVYLNIGNNLLIDARGICEIDNKTIRGTGEYTSCLKGAGHSLVQQAAEKYQQCLDVTDETPPDPRAQATRRACQQRLDIVKQLLVHP